MTMTLSHLSEALRIYTKALLNKKWENKHADNDTKRKDCQKEDSYWQGCYNKLRGNFREFDAIYKECRGGAIHIDTEDDRK